MRNTITETVTHTHHWNESLFSFRTTRSPSYRFENGQFVMVGLEVEGRPLMRAYSVASANWEEELEFFSIKVPDGALTSRLQHIKKGDKITLSTKPSGTLVAGFLNPGKNLFLLSSGTGLAPFLSIIKDPEIYDQFDRVVLVHSVRKTEDLAYYREIKQLSDNEFIGDTIAEKLWYHTIVTREEFGDVINNKRITEQLLNHELARKVGLEQFTTENDRFMLCGNDNMIKDVSAQLEQLGFTRATSRTKGDYVVELAFIER